MNQQSSHLINHKIVIIGIGAIGGITAGFLKKAGHNVTTVCKYLDLAKKIKSQGLRIEGVKGSFDVTMAAVPNVRDLSFSPDFIFLAVKATDLPPILESIQPLLKETTKVISMQNGICEDMVAKAIGKSHVVGCVTGWGATMRERGHLEMTSTGEFVIGNLDNSVDEHLKMTQRILSDIVPCEITQNIYGHLYSKLIVNSCITSLGALTGQYLGEMLKIKKARVAFIQIIQEAMMVAEVMGWKIPPYGGKLDYRDFQGEAGFFENLKRHLLIRIIGYKYRKLKSSSLQSLERGRPTEIDFFNGYIVDKAKKHDISVPVNQKLIEMIKEIENDERQIIPGNLKELAIYFE